MREFEGFCVLFSVSLWLDQLLAVLPISYGLALRVQLLHFDGEISGLIGYDVLAAPSRRQNAMNHQQICTWLGIADAAWPPDHYRLLGLETGETDIQRIEEQVHGRLESVRRYQLTHPELVTEAMNRLAQAFVCLTDPAAKQAYDLELQGEPKATAVAVEEPPEGLAWLHSATGDLVPLEEEAEPAEQEPLKEAGQVLHPTKLAELAADATPPDIIIPEGLPPNIAAAAAAEKTDPAAASASEARARRGIGTKRTLYFRIARTRKLLAAWEQAGRFLAPPQRRITKPTEATELIRLLARIQSLLSGFPPVMGQAGQPGYHVIALASQTAPVPVLQTLLPSQREALAQHWEAGKKFLTAHRQFLRDEARARRKRSTFGRATRAAVSFIAEYPEYVLFALALLAVTIAIARL
jgi:hypothetical protein